MPLIDFVVETCEYYVVNVDVKKNVRWHSWAQEECYEL